MKPGEVITKKEEINLNKDSKITKIKINILIVSSYHIISLDPRMIRESEKLLVRFSNKNNSMI